MIFVLLSALCSVLVSVHLKRMQRAGLHAHASVDMGQVVTWNYLAAGLLCLWLLEPPLAALRSVHAPLIPLLVLAVVLPGLFLVLARSVRLAGIVRTDVAQRLSLLLSLIAAFVWFGETASAWKLAGLALGLLAVAGVAARPQAPPGIDTAAGSAAGWPWLLLVWMGFALVDVMLKSIAQAGIPFAASLLATFAIAFMLMLAVQSWRHWRGHARFGWRSLGAGLLLGLLNFGNIVFYVRAHRALPEHPALVFASMNIGVVVLGTLVGAFGFGERMGRSNWLAIPLAILAIVLIAANPG
jgi:drug/metabolite transporter (DMT)-like permease